MVFLEFPLKVYMDDEYRQNYFKRIKRTPLGMEIMNNPDILSKEERIILRRILKEAKLKNIKEDMWWDIMKESDREEKKKRNLVIVKNVEKRLKLIIG